MTEARIRVVVEVEGLEPVEGELHRFTAPLTVAEIMKRLPIEGYVAKWDNAIYIVTEMSRGAEKTVSKLKAGDIFYWPPGKVVGIAVRDYQPRPQTVKVGSVGDGYRVVEKAVVGAKLRIALKP